MAPRARPVTDPRPFAFEVASGPVQPARTAIRLLVLGADGRLGRAVVGHLRGDVEVVPVTSPTTPDTLVEPGDVVVNLASTAPSVVGPWALAGSRAGGYLDVAPTESSHRTVEDLALGPAPVAPGVGFAGALGDALAVVAARRLDAPTRVDATVWVPSRRSLLAGATPRERAELVGAVAEPMTVLVDGRAATERIAETRRLAWFPRPVGPHHAVTTPGTPWRTVPHVVPGVHTVRSAVALRSTAAELLQGLGNLARTRWGRGLLDRLAARPGPDRGTAGERWALVVEVADDVGTLVRGWAYGHDRHDVTARIAAALAPRVATADANPSGRPVGAVELWDPEELLDDLAAETDLRWSVTDPGGAA